MPEPVSAPISARSPLPPAELEDLAREARAFMGRSKASATIRAYRNDWRHFEAWCRLRQLVALPAAPETVALYLADLASWAKANTIQRRLSSISQAHQTAGYESPTRTAKVRLTWQGIRRTIGTAPEGKAPVVTADVRAMVDALPANLLGVRDRALLLVGFAGAFRRSELVGLDVSDVEETGDGLVVTLRRSKTDQEGAGRKVGLPYGSRPATCPVRALRAWLDASGTSDGPIFRPVDRHGRLSPHRLSGDAVALVVKRSAARVGLDPARYAGHSLRAGLVTSAAAAGVQERVIAEQTGHRSMLVLRRYIREASLFRENAAAAVGL
jgi:integrase